MKDHLREEAERLNEALLASPFTVAVTGAGISIASGGVTYAGMAQRSGGRGMFSGDPDSMYQAFTRSFLNSMFTHGPTEAHKALAQLEAEGKMNGIITTNVDCMHTMAGSRNVAEIQGSFQVNICTKCGQEVPGYEIWNHGSMPRCPKCGSTLLPYNIYSHAGLLQSELRKAREWIGQAELILIIGSTGCYTHMYWDYRRHGAKIIQINPGHTYFDRVADLNIREESDPVFIELMNLRKAGGRQ